MNLFVRGQKKIIQQNIHINVFNVCMPCLDKDVTNKYIQTDYSDKYSQLDVFDLQFTYLLYYNTSFADLLN